MKPKLLRKKLKSNFHRIETLVMFSDLYDLLYVKKINAKKHRITFYGKFSKNINIPLEIFSRYK